MILTKFKVFLLANLYRLLSFLTKFSSFHKLSLPIFDDFDQISTFFIGHHLSIFWWFWPNLNFFMMYLLSIIMDFAQI